jgi:putative nucleotidyltransferase with HDIG domain
MKEERIAIDQLRVGLYVRLESWMAHPFLFNAFKIRNEKQLDALRSLGLKDILYVPERSDARPLPVPMVSATPAVALAPDPEIEAMWREKQARREKVAARRTAVAQCERQFSRSVETVKSLMRNLFARPQESMVQVREVISDMVDTLLADKDVLVHVMSSKRADEGAYYHAMNVTVLALLLGRAAGLDEEELHGLGIGCLLHDIGKERIPSQILRKPGALTAAERAFYEMHVEYGVEMALKLTDLPRGAMEVIACHHEMLDGSGFPGKLSGDRVGRLARIAAIANVFDNLCNRINLADSMTPAEALAYMFKHYASQLDLGLLKLFVRHMGVYPPGSLVRLNNEAIGIVVSVRPDQLLHPYILIHDPQVPKEEAVFFDLAEETDLAVVRSLRPADLPREVYEYLSPRTRVSYVVDEGREPV